MKWWLESALPSITSNEISNSSSATVDQNSSDCIITPSTSSFIAFSVSAKMADMYVGRHS